MHEITSHKVNELNNELEIIVLDEPGQGNVCHKYGINMLTGAEGSSGPIISFQNGPLKKGKPNGITNEALLAIVEHRLQGFQSSDFSCRENAIALTKLQEVMMWLHKRTRDCINRGVEGRNET